MRFIDIIIENEDGNDVLSQMKIGMEVEQEHTDDFITRLKIVIDHLREDQFYYTKMKLLDL